MTFSFSAIHKLNAVKKEEMNGVFKGKMGEFIPFQQGQIQVKRYLLSRKYSHE